MPGIVESLEKEKKRDKEEVTVEFLSTPTGASVEIDGIYYGSTPVKIPVNRGVHRVVISMGGYETWDKMVNFYEGLVVNVNLGLKEEKVENEDKYSRVFILTLVFFAVIFSVMVLADDPLVAVLPFQEGDFHWKGFMRPSIDADTQLFSVEQYRQGSRRISGARCAWSRSVASSRSASSRRAPIHSDRRAIHRAVDCRDRCGGVHRAGNVRAAARAANADAPAGPGWPLRCRRQKVS